MTVPLGHSAFNVASAHPLAHFRAAPDSRHSRVFAIVVTVAMHIAVAAGLIACVHVVPLKLSTSLMVHINLTKPKQAEDMAPPPVLQRPSAIAIAMPPPEVTIEASPSPIIMPPQTVAAPTPPPPVAAPQKAVGETRDSFTARLLARLNRFKQYPRAARQAHIEGVVMLHFVMEENGKVVTAEIAKSSGRPVLDAEALALIQRAQPLPALPPDYPTRTLDAVVPVEFSLGN